MPSVHKTPISLKSPLKYGDFMKKLSKMIQMIKMIKNDQNDQNDQNVQK